MSRSVVAVENDRDALWTHRATEFSINYASRSRQVKFLSR